MFSRTKFIINICIISGNHFSDHLRLFYNNDDLHVNKIITDLLGKLKQYDSQFYSKMDQPKLIILRSTNSYFLFIFVFGVESADFLHR